jgi:2-phospho-L-lactate transferase/gluconeogenesis factor (CofD/UPF0052 family)
MGVDPDVVVLAGGTGGAKLARGMLDVVGSERLAVIANTGDDIEIYGAHVSPDPDLISFWLADEIDERGWGLRGDTFEVMDALRALGVDVWFNLGDRDLAWCLERARLLAPAREAHAATGAYAPIDVHAPVDVHPPIDVNAPIDVHPPIDVHAPNDVNAPIDAPAESRPVGSEPSAVTASAPLTPTAALAQLNKAIDVRAQVLPMSDDPVRTWVQTSSGWRSFQEFMIRQRAAGPVEGLEFHGAEQAKPTPEVLAAIGAARAIVIGPSNPLASIAPILAVPGIREALAAAKAPVVAVSPIVDGEVLKGPTASFMAFAALEPSANGVVDFYGELLDGVVADEPVHGLTGLQTSTRMQSVADRRRVAEQVLGFAEALS